MDTNFKGLFIICFLNGYLTCCMITLKKAFIQEVESHQQAEHHNIPKGFFAWTGSCYCLSFCPLLCITQPFLSLLGVSWDVKNVMIHSSVISFSAVIFPSAKLKGDTGVRCESDFFPNRPFSFILWLTFTVDIVGPAAVSVLDFSLHSCWTAVCCLLCVSLWTNTQVHLYSHASINVCVLAHVFFCMYAFVCVCVCVCPGQRSQPCPRITEGLKSPWPPCWSCRATVHRATASHCSPVDKC